MKKILSIIVAGLMLFTIAFSFSSVAQAKQSSRGFQPVTLCHHTSSATNPNVTITVDNQGQLNGHFHHDGDIIPISFFGCIGIDFFNEKIRLANNIQIKTPSSHSTRFLRHNLL